MSNPPKKKEITVENAAIDLNSTIIPNDTSDLQQPPSIALATENNASAELSFKPHVPSQRKQPKVNFAEPKPQKSAALKNVARARKGATERAERENRQVASGPFSMGPSVLKKGRILGTSEPMVERIESRIPTTLISGSAIRTGHDDVQIKIEKNDDVVFKDELFSDEEDEEDDGFVVGGKRADSKWNAIRIDHHEKTDDPSKLEKNAIPGKHERVPLANLLSKRAPNEPLFFQFPKVMPEMGEGEDHILVYKSGRVALLVGGVVFEMRGAQGDQVLAGVIGNENRERLKSETQTTENNGTEKKGLSFVGKVHEKIWCTPEIKSLLQ